MSTSQKNNLSRFFSLNQSPKKENNTNNSNKRKKFEYSNKDKSLDKIKKDNNLLSEYNNPIFLNNLNANINLKEHEYSNLIYNNINRKENEFNNGIKIGEKEDLRIKQENENFHNKEINRQNKSSGNPLFSFGDDEHNKKIINYNYKKICRHFFEEGFCLNGNMCKFSHKIGNTYNFYNKLIIDYNKYINYSQIIPKLLLNKQITLKIIKRPRLMAFKNIVNIANKAMEENRIKLYLDIIDINDKIKELNVNNDY